MLKPGGHFVIETPRYDTLMFKLMGRRERSVSCGGHIYFFTTESLKNLYEAAGFKTVELNYVGRSLTVERLVYNLGVVSKSPGLRDKLDKLVTKLGVKKASFYLNFRDMQRVCVQKVGSARQVSEAAEAVAVAVRLSELNPGMNPRHGGHPVARRKLKDHRSRLAIGRDWRWDGSCCRNRSARRCSGGLRGRSCRRGPGRGLLRFSS